MSMDNRYHLTRHYPATTPRAGDAPPPRPTPPRPRPAPPPRTRRRCYPFKVLLSTKTSTFTSTLIHGKNKGNVVNDYHQNNYELQ